MKIFNPVEIAQGKKDIYESKKNESKKAKPKACQKQIKTKKAVANKKLKFVILQQVNVTSLLLLQILAAIKNYLYSRM